MVILAVPGWRKYFNFKDPKPHMKSIFLVNLFLFFFLFTAYAQETDLAYADVTRPAADTLSTVPTSIVPAGKTAFNINFTALLEKGEPQKKLLLYTRKKKPVVLHFFPGTSNKKALVIGGIHGSELSSIEVAETLINKLSGGEKPYYNVIVIPCLFPDNAELALLDKGGRTRNNTGRHSSWETPDPNRQMPLPGKPFQTERPFDAFARKIEMENRALLNLIQNYQPHRVLSLHSIRDESKAGVFADPRTDCKSMALGFDSDKELALLMAQHIKVFGGSCPGNRLEEGPTARYHLDPPVAAAGRKQWRRFQVTSEKGRARGVTLGTWCSTAVCEGETALLRSAIRTLTIEFPGYKKAAEYGTKEERENATLQTEAYASAIRHYFLHSFFVEVPAAEGKPSAVN
jgi:hypothetical protein